MIVRYAGERLVVCTGPLGFFVSVRPRTRWYRLAMGLCVPWLVYVGRSARDPAH